MKKLLISFVLLLSILLFASEKVELVKDNNIKASHFTNIDISKTLDGKMINFKLIIGHTILGKVSSVTIEDGENGLNDSEPSTIAISAAKRNVAKFIENYRQNKLGVFLYVRELPQESCLSKCAATWCQDATTEAGSLACAMDCLIECHM